MKYIFILITLTFITFSCKKIEDKKEGSITEANTAETIKIEDIIYKGDFVYLADAAVLKGTNFIYGVTLDKKMHELADRVKPAKESDFDMVSVTVKGIIKPKDPKEEGWDEIITITEIITVGDKPSKVDINIGDKK